MIGHSNFPGSSSQTSPLRRARWKTWSMQVIMPGIVVEGVSRAAGYVGDLLFFERGLSIEGIVRALLLNLKYGFHARDIGRHVVLGGPSRINLGPGVSIHHGVVITTGPSGYCHIGRHTHVSHGSVLSAGGGLTIGPNCALSSGLAIHSATNIRKAGLALKDTPIYVSPVRIGAGVLIGANATLLPGISIGDGSVIGAGAVVRTDVAADTVVVGVPSRLLRAI